VLNSGTSMGKQGSEERGKIKRREKVNDFERKKATPPSLSKRKGRERLGPSGKRCIEE